MKKYFLVLIYLIFFTSLTCNEADAAARRTINLRNRGITSLRDPRITRRLGARTRRVDLSNRSFFRNGELLNPNPNQITSFDGIEDFPDTVEEIILTRNQLSDFIGLENAPANLKILILDNNSFSDVDSFPVLNNLEELCLGSNQLTDISQAGFLNLPSLKSLSLSLNQINSLDNIDFPETLEELFLSGNEIENFDLSGFENIRTLLVGINRIDNDSDVSFPPNLIRLSLGSNDISDLSRFNWPSSLLFLFLGGNPITNDDLLSFTPPANICQIGLNGTRAGPATNLQVANLQNLRILDLSESILVRVEVPLPPSMRRLFLFGNQTQGLRREIRSFYRTSNPNMRIRFRKRPISQRSLNRLNALCE